MAFKNLKNEKDNPEFHTFKAGSVQHTVYLAFDLYPAAF
jgi:hypothetical protein